MRSVVTLPVTIFVQFVPVTVGSMPAQTPALRALMIFGLAKPMDTWYPAGPYSWKKVGSPIRRKESCAFWPSRVLVCSHSSPLAIRSAAGVATTPYRPCIMFGTRAWPASGEAVMPSDSYSGQVTILPVMPIVPKKPLVGVDSSNGHAPRSLGTIGITGRIVTCPEYESDGIAASPLAGQALVPNMMQGRYGVVATPAADRIARGEEWLQTNTLDGQKAHDSFLRIGEPTYFQEYGPAGWHVAIGFANPAI